MPGSKEGPQGSLMVVFITRSVFWDVDTKPLRMQRGFWLLTPLDIAILQLLGKEGGSFPSGGNQARNVDTIVYGPAVACLGKKVN